MNSKGPNFYEIQYKKIVFQYADEKLTSEELFLYGVKQDEAEFEYDSAYFERLLKESIVNFRDLCDFFVSQGVLHLLIENSSFSKNLVKHSLIDDNSIKYLADISKKERCFSIFLANDVLILRLFESDLSFEEVLKKYSCFREILSDQKLFRELIERDLISIENIENLLNKIHKYEDLSAVCHNFEILKIVFENFLLNQSLIKHFEEILQDSWWFSRQKITFFKYLENEVSKFREFDEGTLMYGDAYLMNTYIFGKKFSSFEQNELLSILKLSQEARLKFKDCFKLELFAEFDELMNYLKKTEKKHTLNI